MDYKAESLETNFGKGVKIEKGRRSYEQFSCKDGLFARVYQAPNEKDGQLVDTDYHGVIFRSPFQDSDQDYEQFRVLAERLQQASGEEVPNSKARFMDYISHSGLESELSRIGANIRVNLKDRENIRERNNVDNWASGLGHWGGLATDLIAYVSGFAFISQFDMTEVRDDGTTRNMDPFAYGMYGMYGIFALIFEGMIGGMVADSGGHWCGPIHAIGYNPVKIIALKKARQPNFILDKCVRNYKKLEAMSSTVGNQRTFSKLSKKLDNYFGVLENMFLFTKHQRGFSITYDSPNRDNVINFFDYVLEGGNAPQLPNPQTKVKKPKEKEEPIETQPAETNFINPWEVEVPKLEGKKK
jgi:hypothetical protein